MTATSNALYNNSIYYGIIYPTEYSKYVLEVLQIDNKYSALIDGKCATLESSNNGEYGYIYCPTMCFWGGICDNAPKAVARFNLADLIKVEEKHQVACDELLELYGRLIAYLKDKDVDPSIYISWFSLICEI